MEVCSGVWRCVVGCGGGVEVCSGVCVCVRERGALNVVRLHEMGLLKGQ